MGYSSEDEIEARKRAEWDKKLARMKKEKKKALRRRRLLIKTGIPIIIILIVAIFLIALLGPSEKKEKDDKKTIVEASMIETNMDEDVDEEENLEEIHTGVDEVIDINPDDINPSELGTNKEQKYKYNDAATVEYLSSDNMQSKYAMLVDIDKNEILGQVDCKTRMYPASMTKVMTVLVAAENIQSIKEKVEVTIEATDFAYKNDCSIAGFSSGEIVTIEDLFYGTIL